MISEEVFTQALLLTHTYDPNVPSSQRLQAERYLMELRAHPEGLQLAFYLISDRPLPQQQQAQQQLRELQYFWAFNTILEQLPACAEALRNDSAQAEQLLCRLFDFLQRGFAPCAARPMADYVMNKHAQLMVAGLQLLYPTQWDSFFDKLFALHAHYARYATQNEMRSGMQQNVQENRPMTAATHHTSTTSGSASACSSPQPAESYGNTTNNSSSTNGEAVMNNALLPSSRQSPTTTTTSSSSRSVSEMATMYVLRIFEYIDERVVGDRAQPGPEREQRTRNMTVKDALRERVMPLAVEMWCEVLSGLQSELLQHTNTNSNSNTSNSNAVSIARLCLSVLQSYVVWIDIKLLLTPTWMNLLYGLLQMPLLRAEAAEVLLALVTKKQLPGTKLDTLARLRISEIVCELVSALIVRMKQTRHGTDCRMLNNQPHCENSASAGYIEMNNSPNACTSGVSPALFGIHNKCDELHTETDTWSEEDETFESVVARLTMSVAEQFLQLLELLTNTTGTNNEEGTCTGSNTINTSISNMRIVGYTVSSEYRQSSFRGAVRGTSGEDEEGNTNSVDGLSCLASPNSARSLAGSASPYNNNNNGNSNAAAIAAAANGVQDIAFDVTPQLLQNLSDVLHGCVAHLLRLLRLVNLYDLRDEFLPFIQSYVKSPALLPEEAAELLYTLFAHTRLSHINSAKERGEDEDGENEKERRCAQSEATSSSFVAQGYSPNDYALGKNNHNTTGKYNDLAGRASNNPTDNSTTICCADHIWDEAVTTQRKALHNLIRLLYRRQPQLVLEHLQAYVERITTPTSSEQDADEVEAVLRYFYEMGEAIKLDCLRDMDHLFTQLLTRIVTADVLAQHTSSLVHLAFFEVLDRYYVFFMLHREYISVLLHRLLLLPCGVVNRRPRVRARICYLFSHLLSVLKACLVPYAKDMVLALQSILTSVPPLVLPNDARQLYEAIGVLLRVLFTNALQTINTNNSNHAVNGGESNGNASQTNGSPSSSDGVQRNGAANGNDSHTASETRNDSNTEEMRATCALLESVREQAVGALHSVAHGTPSQSVSPLSSPHATRTYESKSSTTDTHSIDAIADAISYLTALAKGLGGLSMCDTASNNNVSGSGSRSMGTSPPTTNTTTITTNSTSTSVCSEVVLRVYLSMTEEVMLTSQHWHAASVVREATGQFFHQMVNTVPYDALVPYFAQYIADCLAGMEFVPELTKLLRLLFQCTSRTAAASAALLVEVLPALWNKLGEVGALSEAAPVISMGVMSESAREKVEVYRQFFALLHAAASKGCARALLVNVHLLRAMLEELMHALELPAELELPKLAVQTFTRLAVECTTMTNTESATTTSNNTQGVGSQREAISIERTSSSSPGRNNTADNNTAISSAQGSTAEQQTMFLEYCVQSVLPRALTMCLQPQFDLKDAKHFMLIGEVGQLCKAVVQAYGEAALQVMYDCLAKSIGEANAMTFCVTVRDAPQMSAAVKAKLRQLLAQRVT